MSLQFNNTTLDDGIIQVIEQTLGFNPGSISGNTALLKQFTGKVNRAYTDATALIFASGGKWQWDDSNHTDYPFITTDMNLGQRDYPFTTDEQGNIILDIYKVMVKNPSGVYIEIKGVDQQSDADMESFYNGVNTTGTPTRYDKTANGIFLDTIPSYNSTDGLKVFINREALSFTTTDTTKMPGFAGTLHEYIPLKASYSYARDKRLANFNDIARDILIWEDKIKTYYGERERDVVRRMTPNLANNR